MNLEEAQKLAGPYKLDKANKSIVVTSDHGVYLNSDILNVQKHAMRNRLKCFVIVGEENSTEVVKAAIEAQDREKFEAQEKIKPIRSRESIAQDVTGLIKRGDDHVSRNDLVKARNFYMQALDLDESSQEAKERLEWCKTTLENEAKIEAEETEEAPKAAKVVKEPKAAKEKKKK